MALFAFGGSPVSIRRLISFALIGLLTSPAASAAVCVNKFVSRSEGPRQIVTLLTGKVTFQEAQSLTRSSIEWVDEKGNRVADAVDLRVVRPMPVGCDGKTSGVVMLVTFLSNRPPVKRMFVKLADAAPVEFDEQQ
jgi:hypothetical protein